MVGLDVLGVLVGLDALEVLVVVGLNVVGLGVGRALRSLGMLGAMVIALVGFAACLVGRDVGLFDFRHAWPLCLFEALQPAAQ